MNEYLFHKSENAGGAEKTDLGITRSGAGICVQILDSWNGTCASVDLTKEEVQNLIEVLIKVVEGE